MYSFQTVQCWDKHSGQAEAYRDGLGGATGVTVREVAFVYCRAGTEVRLGDSPSLDGLAASRAKRHQMYRHRVIRGMSGLGGRDRNLVGTRAHELT